MEAKIVISTKKFGLILSFVLLIIGTLHIVATYGLTHFELSSSYKELASRFDMNQEVSVPTWFEQMLLFVVAVISGLIGLARRTNNLKYYKHWLGLGVIFTFLSLDEGSSLHELFTIASKNTFGENGIFSTFLYYGWVVVGALVFLIVSLAYLKFWLHLPIKTRVLFFISAIIYVSGAIGVEIISGLDFARNGYNFTYAIMNLIEEMMEGIGAIFFIYTISDYAKNQDIKSLVSFK